ncbi:unnamed protein product [Rotaria sp. Silwood2]|nr:unnamed protein product [Rotaria sp. Silwood2]
MASNSSSISSSSIETVISNSSLNPPSNYNSDSVKLLLQTDNKNYKVILNDSKRASSACWKTMGMGFPAKKLHDKDEFIAIPGFASCSKCFETYRYIDSSTTHIKSHKCGTSLSLNQSSLNHYFQSKQPISGSVERTITITKAIAKRKERIREVCARWIAHSMRSFQIVTDPGFKAVIDECLKIGQEFPADTNLSSNDILSCDRTIKNEIRRLAASEKLLLKDRLKEAVKYGGLCISPDIWSDKYRKISYMGATAHFVDKTYKYHSIDLFCIEFVAKKKNGESIIKILTEELISFGLENYLSDIVFVTDRGSNFVKGLNGFTVLFCTAHRFNNILKHTFYQNVSKKKKNDQNETTTTAIEQTPNKTTTTRTTTVASPEIDSEVEMTDDENDFDTDESETDDDTDYSSITISNLSSCAKEVLNTINHCKALVNLDRSVQMEQEQDFSPTADENTNKKTYPKMTTLHQSSVVRWLSLYDLLSSIEKAYHPLKQVLIERKELARLERINMNIVGQLIKFLDPWKRIMNEIQLSNSPSLFLTLPCIGYLQQEVVKLERTMRGGEFCRLPLICMLLNNQNLISCLGMRFFAKRSLHLLETMFQIEDLHVMGTFLHPNYKQLKYATPNQIINCHNSCRSKISTSSTTSISDDHSSTYEPLSKKPKRFLELLMDDLTPPAIPKNNDEVDAYINFQLKDDEVYENPLLFWQQHELTFPYLSKLARKLFCIPCTSAAVEREFSAAGQIVTQRRCNLEPTTVNDILFLRSVENSKKVT